MKLLTDRQEKLWYRKMVKLEKNLLNYYMTIERDHPEKVKEPDGSFCMNAFKAGYYMRSKQK